MVPQCLNVRREHVWYIVKTGREETKLRTFECRLDAKCVADVRACHAREVERKRRMRRGSARGEMVVVGVVGGGGLVGWGDHGSAVDAVQQMEGPIGGKKP